MTLRRFVAVLLLLSVCTCLFSCETVTVPEETEHQHEYHLENTVIGTCSAPGSQTFSCACGEAFQSTVPAPHAYETIADLTGAYFKEYCTVCGVYTITHEQKYVHLIDFEGFEDYKAAAEQEKVSCYRAGGKGNEPPRLELVEDMGDMSLKSTDSNYYLLDKSGILQDGRDFVVSVDVRYETHGRASLFTILCRYTGKGDFAYNGGLVFIEADGRLSTVNDGDPAYYKDVYFSAEGYDTVTVKGNLGTGLYDVYLNEQLVRKDVKYVSASSPINFVCLRYFDVQHGGTYTGYVDNLKLYRASVPEFVIDESEIKFLD